jgi:hypothetical protein
VSIAGGEKDRAGKTEETGEEIRAGLYWKSRQADRLGGESVQLSRSEEKGQAASPHQRKDQRDAPQ